MHPIGEAKERIAEALSSAAGVPKGEALKSMGIAKNQAFGNFESRIAFDIAKRDKVNPVQAAAGIAKKIPKIDIVEKVEAKGPYINFFLSSPYYNETAKSIAKEVSRQKGAKRKAIVEFPAVNPNKPWHIGHLRNAVIGNCAANLLDFQGYGVERADYIDDLGLQVAQSLWYNVKFPSESKEKFDLFVGKQYVEAAKLLENKENEVEIRKVLDEMEKGKGETAKKANAFVEKVVLSQSETSFSYGIFHDYMMFESTIVREFLPIGISMLEKNRALRKETGGKNAGCWVLGLEGDEFKGQLETDKILIRSDGTTTYTGKDIIFHLWKLGLLGKKAKFREMMKQPNGAICYRSSSEGKEMKFGNADVVVNVIGVEQVHPQNIVKYALRKLGYAEAASNYVHVAYGAVRLPEGKFSGRKGTWLGYTADDLMEEGIEKARERMKDAKEDDVRKVVNAAIKYSMLKVGAPKEVVFEWDRALSMEGDSGPYLLYSYVRAMKILEKSSKKEAFGEYSQDEKDLLFKLSQFYDAAESSARNYEPSIMANYLVEAAAMFHSYYAKYRVIGEPEEASRIGIVKAFANVMEKGLSLLGIETVKEM
jgi:arginyl-tRNA synthetase